MTLVELVITDGRDVLQTHVGQLLVGLSLLDGVAVVAIERGGVHDVKCHLTATIDDDGIVLDLRCRGIYQHLGTEVNAAGGVVGKLLLRVIVAWQRGIPCIAVRDERVFSFYIIIVSQLTTQRDAGVDAARVIGRDADDKARVGMRGKVVCCIAKAATLVVGMSSSVGEV